jgi:hypothetical protein
MPTTTFEVEMLLDELEVTAFKREDDEACWMIPFGSRYVSVCLKEDGQLLWMRISTIADLDDLPLEEHGPAMQHYMEVNDRIKVGRFCGYPKIALEVALPIEDGELTLTQFQRCLDTVIGVSKKACYVPNATSRSLSLSGLSKPDSTEWSPDCN